VRRTAAPGGGEAGPPAAIASAGRHIEDAFRDDSDLTTAGRRR